MDARRPDRLPPNGRMDPTGWRLMVAHVGFAFGALVGTFLMLLALLAILRMVVTESTSIVPTLMVAVLFVTVVAIWTKVMMLPSMSARRMGMRHIRLPFAHPSNGIWMDSVGTTPPGLIIRAVAREAVTWTAVCPLCG